MIHVQHKLNTSKNGAVIYLFHVESTNSIEDFTQMSHRSLGQSHDSNRESPQIDKVSVNDFVMSRSKRCGFINISNAAACETA